MRDGSRRSERLRILMLEDSALDAELISAQLQRAGLDFVYVEEIGEAAAACREAGFAGEVRGVDLATVDEDQSRTTLGPLVAPRVSKRREAWAAMVARS